VPDAAEISELGWFARDALPRPISDFTIQRIDDAFAGRPPSVKLVGPRTWLR
jgi:8-oxo-dGTP diphosphatase